MATIYTVHPDTPQVRSIKQIGDALQDGAVMLYPTDTVYAIGCDLNVKSAVERVRRIKQFSNDKPLTFLCPSLSDVGTYARVSDTAYRTMKHLIPGPYTFLLPATKLVPRLVQNPKRKTTGIRVPKHTVCSALLTALGNPIISTSAHLPQGNACGSSGTADKGEGCGDGFPVPFKSRVGATDPNRLDSRAQAQYSAGGSSGGTKSAQAQDEIDTIAVETEMNISRVELFDRLDKLVDVIVDNGEEPRATVSTIVDLIGDEPIIVRRGLGWEEVGSRRELRELRE